VLIDDDLKAVNKLFGPNAPPPTNPYEPTYHYHQAEAKPQ
jgi:hypothetical protein